MSGTISIHSALPARRVTDTRALRVSVIVTNYNYAEYLSQAVSSAQSQSVPPYEIIVVDDGSTDNSAGVLDELEREGIVVIRSVNRGQLGAFVTGYKRSAGDIIAFLDADDIWNPNHLATALNVLYSGENIFYLANCQHFGAANGRFHEFDADKLLPDTTHVALTHEWIGSPTSCIVVPRDCIAFFNHLDDDIISEWKIRADDVVVFAGSIFGYTKYFRAEPTVRYRVHSKNGFFGKKASSTIKQAHEKAVARIITYLSTQCGFNRALWAEAYAGQIMRSQNLTKKEKIRTIRKLRKSGLISKYKAVCFRIILRMWLNNLLPHINAGR